MTFDEAIEKIESITDELNIRQEIINDVVSVVEGLRKDYAPTIEMKPYQFEVFKKYRYGVSKGDIDFGGIWPDEPYRMMEYFKEEPYTGTTIWDDSFAQAWLHPETIKIVDE
ncbi:hypothetical protein [Leuconostoc mesenteroides]|uniref:hypothetical protein n=1 Tax=Leuconostoc mesenteroides TaxID=1245 RepID=UPI002362F39F|nr:hypothetical protein [Leuconostoc mesenteroides]